MLKNSYEIAYRNSIGKKNDTIFIDVHNFCFPCNFNLAICMILRQPVWSLLKTYIQFIKINCNTILENFRYWNLSNGIHHTKLLIRLIQ